MQMSASRPFGPNKKQTLSFSRRRYKKIMRHWPTFNALCISISPSRALTGKLSPPRIWAIFFLGVAEEVRFWILRKGGESAERANNFFLAKIVYKPNPAALMPLRPAPLSKWCGFESMIFTFGGCFYMTLWEQVDGFYILVKTGDRSSASPENWKQVSHSRINFFMAVLNFIISAADWSKLTFSSNSS